MPIPFVEPPVVRLGTWQLDWTMAAWAVAVLLQYALMIRRVERRNGPAKYAAELYVTVLAFALGSAVAIGGGSTAYAVPAAALGAFAYYFFRRRELGFAGFWRIADDGFAVAPPSLILVRAGCVIEHAHAGIRSDSWLAVRYGDSSRWDLALLEVLFWVALWALFQMPFLRFPWHAPIIFGSYGIFRGAIAPLRIDFTSGDAMAAGLILVAAAISILNIWNSWERKLT